MGLLFISPFLNKILTEWNKNVLKKLLIFMFIALSISATVVPTATVFYSDIVWFVFIYIFVGYFKKYINKSGRSAKQYFLLSFVIYILIYSFVCICKLVAMHYVAYSRTLFLLGEYYGYYLQTIPSFCCAFFAFLGFKDLNIGSSKLINTVSSATFGVYIYSSGCGILSSLVEVA